jgi:hypothetical protein
VNRGDRAIDVAAIAVWSLVLAFGSWWQAIVGFVVLVLFLRSRGWEGDV